MQVINWLALQPQPADLKALNESLRAAVLLPRVCQLLVETILRAPQNGRPDLIACYHPSQSYQPGQKIALLIPGAPNPQRFVWQVAEVKQTRSAATAAQGHFQVVTLDIHGRQIQMAGEVAGASYPEADFANFTTADMAWLAQWVWEAHGASVETIVRHLIEGGQIRGQLAGQTFLPERVATISSEILDPVFAGLSMARPWIGPEEILKGLPDLAWLDRERALVLIRASLKQGLYRWLGADRWTTQELFRQLDREVPHGLTTPQLRAKTSPWTRQDVQDLAGYGRRFMPGEARRRLEELETGERLAEADRSPWRPAHRSLRMPPLSYLHITQAYLPVGDMLGAFGPDTHMIFLHFMDGNHQPFLLDREHGVLKALAPANWRSKILEDGLPAGTSLWLEEEGNENYRLVPRELPFKRMVPCKLAQLKDGQLHIEQTRISMKYEGLPSLFRAALRSEDVEALHVEASRLNLRLREAMIYCLEKICATDPDRRAHWQDLFNAVFLLRNCSPSSVAFLLYTQPCFESVGEGYFRYRSAPAVVVKKVRRRPDRLSQLWDGLLAQQVWPVPPADEPASVKVGPEDDLSVSSPFAPERALPSFLSQPQPEPERPMQALTFVVVDTQMSDELPDPFRDPQMEASMDANDRLKGLGTGQDDAQAEFSLASPGLRPNARPAWLDGPAQPRSTSTENARRLIYRPRLPIRPLHKQPFYRRIFYYLRGWLHRKFGKNP